MTLVDRLRAAIEERKVLAEVLDGESWTAVHDCGGDSYISQGGSSGIGRDEDSSGADFGLLDPAEANLMETNSPSAVLRRCKADLALLDEHARVWLENQWVEGVDGRHLASVPVCRTCEPPKQLLGPVWPCRTIVLLAEGYGIEIPR